MENAVRLREVHDHATEDQWRVMESKMAGYSAEQIAEKRGGSADAVNMIFSRAKHKLARLLNRMPSGGSGRRPEQRTPVPSRESSSSDGAHTGRRDGELASAPGLVCVHHRE
jgi:hypothetical protein